MALRNKRLKTIDSFFRPGPPAKENIIIDSTSVLAASESPSISCTVNINIPPASVLAAYDIPSTSETLNHTPAGCHSSALRTLVPASNNPESLLNDIGNFLNAYVDSSQKYQLIENSWKPPPDYQLPYSIHLKDGKERKRFRRQEHLSKYNWLVFSPSRQGLFCKYCALFTVGQVAGGQKTVQLQKLVVKPLTKFFKLLGEKGDLEDHSRKIYHKEAVIAGKLFIQNYKNPQQDVRNQLNSKRLQDIEENRRRLKPIIECILFLGRQNIPLRGNRDDGKLDLCDNLCNEGNFRELLKFKINSGDKVLENHLENCSSRATYISKSTQNQLIKCCGEETLNVIITRVQEASFYSIIFDETTDLSHRSQVSIILCYYGNGVIKEDFVGFLDAYEEIEEDRSEISGVHNKASLTGENLGKMVLKQLKKLGLCLDHCVGVGTDGCSVMLSEAKGAVIEIQKEAPNAIRSPCYSHALNLSLSKCNGVSEVRNVEGTMKEVINFFKASAKRNHVLQNHLGSQLSGLCETRWVERHDGVLQFNDNLDKIIKALDEISTWNDNDTSSKASVLSSALVSSTFMVCLICLSDILSKTLPLSKLLQKQNFDLSGASQLVSDTISVLKQHRYEAGKYFEDLWKKIEQLAAEPGVELNCPCLCGRQTHWANFSAGDSTMDYYRKCVFVPLLDFIILDLNERFSASILEVFHLSFFLLPSNIRSSKFDLEYEKNSIENVIKHFRPLLNVFEAMAHSCFKGEFSIWKQKWKKSTHCNKSLVDLVEECDGDVFPIIRWLILLIVTLPVSVASAERSFSSLRRLKSWIQTRMSQERLTGLALIHVHRYIDLSIDEIIDRFAKLSRHHEFVL